jgi:hypothetical protein
MYRFITQHGSVYDPHHRYKFNGSVHDRGHDTVFVECSIADRLIDVVNAHRKNGLRCNINLVEGQLVVVVFDETGYIDDHCRKVPFYTEPKVGLCPIELWDNGATKFHVGHPIVHME